MPMPLDKFKKLLGPLADKLTDEQIEWLLDAETKIADAIIDLWLREKNPLKKIDHESEVENSVTNMVPSLGDE